MNRFIPVFAVLLLIPASSELRAAVSDAAKKSAADDVRVRFYCPAVRLRPKFDGRGRPIPPRFEEAPPPALFAKNATGESYSLPLSPDSLGAEIRVPAKIAPGGALDIEAARVEWPDTPKSPAPAAVGKPESSGPAKVYRMPFLKIAVPPGRPHLVCLFKPDPNALWFPPKTLSIDISKEKVPEGSRLVVNLSAFPAAVAFGADAPVMLAPASFVVLPKPPAETGDPVVKIAVQVGKNYLVVKNGPVAMPADGAAFLAVTSIMPQLNAGIPAILNVSPLPSDAPAEASDKKSAPGR